MAKRKKKKKEQKLSKVVGVILFFMAMLIMVALITHHNSDDYRITGEIDRQLSPFEINFKNQGGIIGAYFAYFAMTIFGWLSFFIPFGLVLISLRLFKSEIFERIRLNSFLTFVISLLATMIYNIHILSAREIGVGQEPGGGLLTENLTLLSTKIVGETGSYIVLSGIIVVLLLIFTSIAPLLTSHLKIPGFTKKASSKVGSSAKKLFSLDWLKSLFFKDADSEEDDDYEDDYDEPSKNRDEITIIEDEPEEDYEEVTEGKERVLFDREKEKKKSQPKKKTTIKKTAEQLQLGTIAYAYPGTTLLKENEQTQSTVNKDELTMTSRMLKETLETFNVKVEGEISAYPGPIITRYEFKPGTGVKINQIVNLADDLALALKAKRIRIVAPIPGKAAVGVEIPNREPQMVYLREILESDEFHDKKKILPLCFGKTISGRPFVADLTKMPHLLIAGATGSGKSVGMNVMITSLLYRLHPHQVRFIFIDPKMLELSIYSGIPHLARPVVTKPKRAEKVLADAVNEMENRYRKLANVSVRNIADFNAKQTNEEDKLPYIVICVDELADLMMSATSSRIEQLITRLAQMSRAVGIHLILATQRPSVDVITGLIKANFPARVAYQVSTKVDSRTILDCNGAEKLLGNGDMLFLETGLPEPRRVHGAFLSSDETESIVTFIKEQGLEMMALEGITQSSGEPTEAEVDFGDPLFKEACEVVIRHKQGSVSLLQRRLGIGYQRAARLIDKLEQAGIVSPFDGSKARDVLVDKSFIETLFANAGRPTEIKSD